MLWLCTETSSDSDDETDGWPTNLPCSEASSQDIRGIAPGSSRSKSSEGRKVGDVFKTVKCRNISLHGTVSWVNISAWMV